MDSEELAAPADHGLRRVLFVQVVAASLTMLAHGSLRRRSSPIRLCSARILGSEVWVAAGHA